MGWSAAALIAGAVAMGACADSIDVGASLDPDGGGAGGDSGGPAITPDSGALPKTRALQCPTSECATGYATCPSSTFVCDVDLTSSNSNCGSCGVVCPNGSDLNARSICADGRCQLTCNPGYADCNGILDDGCEQILDEIDNCGTCGHKCAPGEPCIDIAPFVPIGKCGCPDGKTWCGSQCVDLTSSDGNCGECGNVCPPPPDGSPPLGAHMHYGCLESQCAKPKCDDPENAPPRAFVDCNGNTGDGCESNVYADSNNCGACGLVCPPGQVCSIILPDELPGCACPAGRTKCLQDSLPGYASCVDLLSDNENCGACGYRCPGNEGAICDHGLCVQICPEGYAECDGDPSTSCETNIMTDPYNCGACNAHCDGALPQPCQGGRCWTKDCDAGGPGVQ